MTVYIDNNIVVSIEDGDYSIESIRNLIPDKKVRFFYSKAHVFEAEGFAGNSTISKQGFLSKRFETIRRVFSNNYLYLDLKGNRLTHIIEDPQEVYDTITAVPFGIDAIRGLMNLGSKEDKEKLRQDLGIDMLRINNYSSKDVVAHLSTKLLFGGQSMSFIEMIEYGINLHPDGKTFGLHNRFAAVFELLDMLGYWKDKETETSNYARLWDADHCNSATYCDYFVSDDKRTRNKAAVAYEIYGKKTKILSSKG